MSQPLGQSAIRPVHVAQGEFHVDSNPDAIITAILGSCVAACLWDPQRGVGGMNHILLPDVHGDATTSSSFAINLMELLINGLLRAGADKRNLQAKLFGGASMVSGLGDIGRRNGEVTRSFLQREGIPCVSESLGGTQGRKVQFWPATGRARQMLIENVQDVPIARVAPPPPASDVELF